MVDLKPGANPIKLFTSLPANIGLGCKGLPGTTTLAYYENSIKTDVKFCRIDPCPLTHLAGAIKDLRQ